MSKRRRMKTASNVTNTTCLPHLLTFDKVCLYYEKESNGVRVHSELEYKGGLLCIAVRKVIDLR